MTNINYTLPSRFGWIATNFIFAIRTLFFAIANGCTWHTFTAFTTQKCFLWTILWSRFLINCAFFIGGIGTIWSAIANKVPTNALTTGTALECIRWATGQIGRAQMYCFRCRCTITTTITTVRVRIGQLTLSIRFTIQTQWNWSIAQIDTRTNFCIKLQLNRLDLRKKNISLLLFPYDKFTLILNNRTCIIHINHIRIDDWQFLCNIWRLCALCDKIVDSCWLLWLGRYCSLDQL